MAGLSLLLAAARRGHEARRGLRRSRRETAAVSRDRNDLLGQRDAARDRTDSTHVNGSSPAGDVPASTSSPAE